MKSIKDFLKDVEGTSFDYDKVSGIQCVDLIKKYLNDCFNIKIPNGFGNAVEYYNSFDNKKLLNENFDKIKNTPEFVPNLGDIVVWNEKRGKGAGHIAICTGEGDTHEFYSYDLNWSGSKSVKKVKHNYTNVLGFLRKKNILQQGDFVKVEVKFTGALTSENGLVELNKNQFWIGLDEFIPNIKENKYYIYGQIAFIKEFTSGVAFHYFDNKQKREFQIEIENKKLERIN